MIPLRVAGLVLLLPTTAGADTITFQTTAFSQGVSIQLPDSFQPGYEDLKDGGYILELVPKGETVDGWSELFTLTAFEGQTGIGQAYADSILDSFATACPNSFAHAVFDLPQVAGAKAVAAGYASCGDLGGYSESVVLIALDGVADVYSLQWAERGEVSEVALEYDAAHWGARLDFLAAAEFTLP